MSASVFSQDARESDAAKAADWTLAAIDCHKQARDLTHMADELVTQSLLLPDCDPKRRAGLCMASALRQGANGYTDAAETFEVWAADLLAHAGAV